MQKVKDQDLEAWWRHQFCRAMLCISAAYAVMQCVCVCLSVTFVDCVITDNHTFEIYFTIG